MFVCNVVRWPFSTRPFNTLYVILGAVNIITLFVDRIPKWFINNECTFFRQGLTTALLNSAEDGERPYFVHDQISKKGCTER